MSLTAEFTNTLRILEQDAFGTSGRTTRHRIDTLKMTGATRHDSKIYALSAGLSNVEVNLSPVTASDPGGLLWLNSDQPVDVRLNASTASVWSAVRQLMLGMSTISALFLTPPASAVATVRLEVVGGGTLSVSTPLP